MKRSVNRRTVLAGAGAAATSLATGVRLAHAADPVKVGVLFPLTGNAAAAGQASKAAVEIAAEIVNNAHPELASIPLAKDAGLPGLGGADDPFRLGSQKAGQQLPPGLRGRPAPAPDRRGRGGKKGR